MAISGRVPLLLLLGLVGVVLRPEPSTVLLWLLGVLVLVGIDLAVAPSPATVRLTRREPGTVRLGDPAIAAAIVTVVTFVADPGAQDVETAIQVVPFPGLQAAGPAIAVLQTGDGLELGAQVGRFAAGQGAVSHALVDPVIKLGLALVDVHPGRGGGGHGGAGEHRGGQQRDQKLFHIRYPSLHGAARGVTTMRRDKHLEAETVLSRSLSGVQVR